MEIPEEVLDHAVVLSQSLLSARYMSPDFAGEFEKRTLKNALEYAFKAGAAWERERVAVAVDAWITERPI